VMDWKLIGLAVVVAGFALRLNALAVIFVAGVSTGLAAGFSWTEIMAMVGRFFVDNRNLTLPVILMVPVVGLLERHGLQQRVAALIRQAKVTSAGQVLWLYQCLRELTSMVGLSIGNHASMVRPLIVPMAEAAAKERGGGKLAPADSQTIRAQAGAAENTGNFFADDIFVAIGALLLIKGFFDTAKIEVSLRDIQLWSLPTALWVMAVGWWRFRRLDRQIRKDGPVSGTGPAGKEGA